MKSVSTLFVLICLLNLTACSRFGNKEVVPAEQASLSLLDSDSYRNLPTSAPLIVGVYEFTDQTGQRAVLDRPTSEMSTAVPQGLASMLVQELKAVDDGKWFRVVEREGISKILNERQIVTATLGDDGQLQPLLLPGIIITGGAVSYDRKVYQEFNGLGVASVNAKNEVYSDQVSIALRVVSVQTGEVIEAIFVTKSILSQMNGLSGLKIINTTTLGLEAGSVENEPVSIATRMAIAAAVEELRKRGIENQWWTVAERSDPKGVK